MATLNTEGGLPRDVSNVEPDQPPSSILMSEIISALSYALDLTEGQPMGHSVRTCIMGMRLAKQIGMSRPNKPTSTMRCCSRTPAAAAMPRVCFTF